jgi:hypothetical protein
MQLRSGRQPTETIARPTETIARALTWICADDPLGVESGQHPLGRVAGLVIVHGDFSLRGSCDIGVPAITKPEK